MRARRRRRRARPSASIAEPLGAVGDDAAAGILRVNNHAAATLIRQRTLEQGLDPRDFVVYAYGGAGPLHAWGFAAELGCPAGDRPARQRRRHPVGVRDRGRRPRPAPRGRVPGPQPAVGRRGWRPPSSRPKRAARASMPGQEPQLSRVALMRYAEQLLQSVPVVLRDGADRRSGLRASCWRTSTPSMSASSARSPRRCSRPSRCLRYGSRRACPAACAKVRPAQPAPRPASHAASARCTGLSTGLWRPRSMTVQRWRDDQRIDGPAVIELAYTTVPVAPGQHLIRDAATDNLILSLEV